MLLPAFFSLLLLIQVDCSVAVLHRMLLSLLLVLRYVNYAYFYIHSFSLSVKNRRLKAACGPADRPVCGLVDGLAEGQNSHPGCSPASWQACYWVAAATCASATGPLCGPGGVAYLWSTHCICLIIVTRKRFYFNCLYFSLSLFLVLIFCHFRCATDVFAATKPDIHFASFPLLFLFLSCFASYSSFFCFHFL